MTHPHRRYKWNSAVELGNDGFDTDPNRAQIFTEDSFPVNGCGEGEGAMSMIDVSQSLMGVDDPHRLPRRLQRPCVVTLTAKRDVAGERLRP